MTPYKIGTTLQDCLESMNLRCVCITYERASAQNSSEDQDAWSSKKRKRFISQCVAHNWTMLGATSTTRTPQVELTKIKNPDMQSKPSTDSVRCSTRLHICYNSPASSNTTLRLPPWWYYVSWCIHTTLAIFHYIWAHSIQSGNHTCFSLKQHKQLATSQSTPLQPAWAPAPSNTFHVSK
jgi:hypothetical protein